MRTVIEKTKKHSVAVILTIIVAAVAITIASLYAAPAEALSEQSVGIIGGEVNARANDGWEFVTISYSGVGEMDVAGWSIHSEQGPVFTITDDVIPSGGQIRICEDAEVQGDVCDYAWEGGEQFNDTTGGYYLHNELNEVVFTIEYEDADDNTRMPIKGQIDAPYVTSVYAQNDKVTFCHNDSRKGLQEKRVNAGTFITKYLGGKNGHHADEGDIIPSFFYESKGALGFYAGKNWEGNEAVVAGGCQ